jgi:hypothetical protein
MNALLIRSLSIGAFRWATRNIEAAAILLRCNRGERRVEIFTRDSTALHDQLPAFSTEFPSICHVVVNKACDLFTRELADVNAQTSLIHQESTFELNCIHQLSYRAADKK